MILNLYQQDLQTLKKILKSSNSYYTFDKQKTILKEVEKKYFDSYFKKKYKKEKLIYLIKTKTKKQNEKQNEKHILF